MADFNEFDGQGSTPSQDSGSIISHAFEMYKGVLLYAVLAFLIYMALSWVIQLLSGFNSETMIEEMKNGYESINYWSIPGMKTFYSLTGLLSIFISPLYVGMIFILNRYNNRQPVTFADLFIGYRQNLGNILLYSIVASILISIAAMLCFLPVLFVFPLLLLGYPILLFENASVGDALSKAYNIAKNNYGVFFLVSLVGFLLSLSGIILCFVGIVLTAFFFTAIMYSTYVAYCGKPRPLIDQV